MARASSTEEEAVSAEEMLAAQAQVYNVVMGHIGTMCLKSAIELNILEIVHNAHVLSHSDLLSKLPNVPPWKSPFVHRIMRLLAQMGYFKIGNKDEEVLYSLTPLSKMFLLKNKPLSLSPYLGLLTPPWTNVWYSLSDWLQSDGKGCMFEFEHGKSTWDIASHNPELNSGFNEAMAADSRVIMKAVVDQCSEAFKGLHTLVDVGGGTGTSALAIAQAHPGLKCTVYDLPHVIASVPPNSLIDAISGNMFESIPQADAIFLKWILHDWTDEDCVKILKKCKDAIPNGGGKVIIVDFVLNDNKNSSETFTQLLFDASMMAYTDGKERTEYEWKRIFLDAGFTDYKITPIGLRSLIEVFP
ncbi:uncharacterized protein A4U43_C09F10310 [Asparagus officinalis]|uniref:O-methyltransferase domain-containing protein n=1 Tax=Asparagus officinalis TaxID=4686 RepID=A0A5P1E6S1_ASPOF|nr:trans-resveratrol di-O-methyltransferase-like [Asparagus officinalis]ONK58260.1 uncharacterized protein A4U43_C09F10310 [Asparagus officinalis]